MLKTWDSQVDRWGTRMLALLAEGWVVAVLLSLVITVVITGVVAGLALVIVETTTHRSSSPP